MSRQFALIAILVVGLVGCGGSDSDSDPSPPPPPDAATTETTETPDPPAPTGPDAEELASDIDVAEEITNGFWTDNWSRFFTGSYSAPTVIGLYDGTDANAPTCGGEALSADNAYYCKPEDFVAWDVGLLSRGFEIGDSWVYLVIAHEWGHAIQAQLSAELQSQAAELQADCLAGATIYGAAQDEKLATDEGDEKELVKALSELSDETPWTSISDHGDSFERVEAFNAGRRGGVEECLPQETQ